MIAAPPTHIAKALCHLIFISDSRSAAKGADDDCTRRRSPVSKDPAPGARSSAETPWGGEVTRGLVAVPRPRRTRLAGALNGSAAMRSVSRAQVFGPRER